MRLDKGPATARLRGATAAAHAALEGSDLVLPQTLERDSYARLVGAMLAFHRAIEREFARFADPLAERGIDVRGRLKLGLLEAESAALESPAVETPQFAFPGAAYAAGGVYVMEGSTLGGAVIARSLLRHQGLRSRYYGCYGAEAAQRWRATVAELDAFAREPGEVEMMIAGARQTFDALRDHLSNALLSSA